MKKLFILVLAAILALGLSACGINAQSNETSTSAFTTEAPTMTNGVTTEDPSRIYEIQLYSFYEDENLNPVFTTRTARTDGTIYDVVSLLIQENQGVPLSFTPDNKGGAHLDMNAAFQDTVYRNGSLSESQMMHRFVNTILKYYQLDSVIITVEGKTLDSGHFDYNMPLTFYDPRYN